MRLGDLDALKDDFECVGFNDYDDFNRALRIIDNAPTVEPTFKPIAEVKFDKEQLQEIVDKAKAEVLASVERPQGDLISREALLKRVDEEREYLKSRGQLGAEHILVHNFRDLIDNAPTVEAIPLEFHEKAMDVAVTDLFKVQEELNRIKNEKRQGEWSKPIMDVYTKCSNCQKLSVYYSDFCPNCGAEMKPKTCTNCETFGQNCGDCEVGDDD